MNLAAAIAIASAAISLAVAVVSWRISRAPGSRDQRWFAVVALASAAYALCNLSTTLAWSPQSVVWLSRVQFASVVVNLWAWLHYANAFLRNTPGRRERVLTALLPALAIAAFVPGLVFGNATVDRPYAPLRVVYRVAVTTGTGGALILLLVGLSLLLLVRFVRAWRAGVPQAGLTAGAFAALVLLGVNDALANTGADLPFLLDTGVAIPVLAVAWVITARFVASARELDRLREALLAEVDARTRDLATALDALHQSEKLAALGQFANGVAHEVNSPAAVVATSLRYLADSSASGRFPPDAAEVIEDALAAMKRINDLVRKLVDAGRVAAVPGGVSTVAVGDLVAKAAAEVRLRGAGRITVSDYVPEGLAIRARRDALEQVLSILVANAVEAIPRDRAGRIELRADRTGTMARISVRDDGVGMSPEVLRRAFDPFFTTKPEGAGAGLGLPVARGIVEANGGTVWLETHPGAGTTAVLELPDVVDVGPSAG